MRSAWKVFVVVAVFVGVGLLTAKVVAGHAVAGGTMQPEVKLAGEMAGLFAGGAAAVVVGIALVWRRK